jgi:DNA-binding NtrC family response regulator
VLTRIFLVFESKADRARLRRILDGVGSVVLHSLPGRPRREDLIATVGELIVIDRELLPEALDLPLRDARLGPGVPEIVVLSRSDDPEDRARLLASGCFAVLHAGVGDELLHAALAALIARRRDEATARLTPPQTVDEPRLDDFVSRSPAMQAFMEVVYRVVRSDTTLLVVGETGVGKERLAQAIHGEGPRSRGPFVAVNCGAIPEALLESELFGHREGAFTGAMRARRGWFELAHGGTIFLDEIGEMPLHLQVKLLRVLQTREVVPVGSESPVSVDVRVMAATNRNLEDDARAKRFRGDLYYRLSVVTLEIPPLRERREDIPTLIERYVEYFQSKLPTSVEGVAEEARAAMIEYSWPGNVREFVNAIERAMLLCGAETITLADLPEPLRRGLPPGLAAGDLPAFDPAWLKRTFREVRAEVVARLERQYLDALLRATGGRIEETAARAGINPRNLYEKMRRHGLRKEEYRKRG